MLGINIQTTPEQPSNVYVESRFGTIALNRCEKFDFPQGIIGFPHEVSYVLTTVPGYDEREDFFLLQSTTNANLAFIVMPLEPYLGNEAIEKEVAPYIKVFELDQNNVEFFSIVSLGQGLDRSEITINLRAPLLFDMNQKKAWQIIIDNQNYEIAHKLLAGL